MHYGSKEKGQDEGQGKEAYDEAEDDPQNRSGEEVDCEEDGYGSS
jgi:hypothetical protein